MYDLLIKNGTIADGTGAKAYRADIAVKDGEIARIGASLEEPALRELEAAGLTVSPGFIDAHTHTDRHLLFGRDGYNYLEQGVTTQITGPCGISHVPYYDDCSKDKIAEVDEAFRQQANRIAGSFASYIEHLHGMRLGTNYAFFAAQGNIRGKVMGFGADTPTADQMDRMKALLAEAMQLGFLGFSTGLIYPPSAYAGQEELLALAEVAVEYGGIYSTHIRNEGNGLLEAVEEAIAIGERAGIPVIISHLKVVGRHNEGLSQRVVALIEEANARGVRVSGDMYPYTGGSGGLSSFLPPKYAAQGAQALRDHLRSAEFRDRVRADLFSCADGFESNLYSAGYENCLVARADQTPQAVGKTLEQLAQERGAAPFDALCDLLIENPGDVQMIFFNQNESDMLRFLTHPLVCSGSDWSEYKTHFPAEQAGGAHPRGTATAVRRLELIRDKNLLSMEESIRRITSLTADLAGLGGIGRIEEGLAADLCVFDYQKLRAHADYTHPFRKNDGIEYVVLGGEVVVEQGAANGILNGRVLTRSSR